MKLASKIWLSYNLPSLYHLSYDLPFLYGPLLYLFVKCNLSSECSSLWHGLHFLPFVLSATSSFWKGSLGLWYINPSIITSFEYVSLVVYHGLIWQNLWQNRVTLGPEQWRWLKELTLASGLLTLTLTLTIHFMYLSYPRWTELRYLFALATLFIYWVSYKFMGQPQLMLATWSVQLANSPQSGKKYQHSTLQLSDMQLIVQQLAVLMQHQRLYLDPKLSIDDLATLVGSNRHHLSQVLNECLQKNYYEYLNTYRVEAAQALLLDPAQAHLKIAAIAYNAGFNSLSTFNEVFKKMLGCTPSEFRKMEQEKMAYLNLITLPDRSDR